MFRREGDLWAIVYDGESGRPVRRAASAVATERMRKAVANSIRYAIARIEKESPVLALHLTNSIRTGAACSYVPDLARGMDF